MNDIASERRTRVRQLLLSRWTLVAASLVLAGLVAQAVWDLGTKPTLHTPWGDVAAK